MYYTEEMISKIWDDDGYPYDELQLRLINVLNNDYRKYLILHYRFKKSIYTNKSTNTLCIPQDIAAVVIAKAHLMMEDGYSDSEDEQIAQKIGLNVKKKSKPIVNKCKDKK